jgi:hypothetical protein
MPYNFLRSGEALVEGGDFFEGYERGAIKLVPGYTYQNIKRE